MEVWPGHYQTSVVFNSLDSTRDGGEYTCAVRVTNRIEGFADAIKESTASRSITVPSKFLDMYQIIVAAITLLLNVLLAY